MSETHSHKEKPFSLLIFVITIGISVTCLLGALKLVAPEVWKVQIEASWVSILAVFLSMHLVNAFGEFFFHRYVLHAPLLPFLRYFYKRHTFHHGLTHVVLRQPGRRNTSDKPVIENVYPILEEKQHEASFFPWYTLLVFSLLSTPVFAVIQWMLPHAPIFLGGYAAITFSLVLYELFHAVEHFPLEKWRPFLDHRLIGKIMKKIYGFHLRHHASHMSNESISGFFGIPIPDYIFGTYINPLTLYEHGKPGTELEFSPPTPRFIKWLDRLAERSLKRKKKNTSKS